ncbi:integrase arm-type DNA-binding domain-containing protein [Testudinibacter aquarius]|uniref:DUF4102 domain-containing protein n=1 Tax=Testudinibacter aquarius TaxID=1524974 RepID=A0A4R3Y443_9PAST|nr:integrase arm-type DNA-binding domain-containing protein [Testudinibacter aquarius]KAE9528053.1 hypothetical protein A1D24_01440 [Testudinibacter aquarius]TCV86510.1 uncharacterized protein DUF4102 [Testudinibacter aquarius]TNG92643.1 DUF4102 domain-containing protein [Testudinibacter aquarius]
MPKITKPLTNTEIEKLKAKNTAYDSRTDGGGLYLLVKPNGVKTWQFNYYKPITKKRTYISLNNYPDLSLVQEIQTRGI